jgi:beta-lactamase regulating signal transducer with metallopeptidase domain
MNETLLVLLVKSALLSAAGLMIVALLRQFAARRVSAAVRHLICLSTFATLASLPVLSVVLPTWRLVLPVSSAVAVVSPETSRPQYPYGWAIQHPDDPYPRRATDWATPPTVPVTAAEIKTGAAITEAFAPPTQPKRSDVGQFAIFAYLAGVGVLLTHLFAGHLAVWRMVRRAVRVPGLTFGGVPVRESAEVAVPLTAGMGRSAVIVLPTGFAASVSPEQLQAVLAHEAAHIRRADYLSQSLADIVCALYFVNPLVWLLSGAMRSEAERAADDRVLAENAVRPSDYAAHLLDIARGLRNRRQTSYSAVTMARRASVSARIQAVLAANMNRAGRVAVPGIFAIGLTCSALAGGIATLRPAGSSEAMKSPASVPFATAISAAQFRKVLADGTVIELDYVTGPGAGENGSPATWKPNGEPRPGPFYMHMRHVAMTMTKEQNMYGHSSEVIMTRPNKISLPYHRLILSLRGDRVRNLPLRDSVQVDSSTFTEATRGLGDSGQTVFIAGARMRNNPETATLHVRVPHRNWQPLHADGAFLDGRGGYLGRSEGRGVLQSTGGNSDINFTYLMTRPAQTAKGTVLKVTTGVSKKGKLVDADYRYIADTWRGKKIAGRVLQKEAGKDSTTSTVLLPGIPLARVKSFTTEARVYDQVTFPSIALTPRSENRSGGGSEDKSGRQPNTAQARPGVYQTFVSTPFQAGRSYLRHPNGRGWVFNVQVAPETDKRWVRESKTVPYAILQTHDTEPTTLARRIVLVEKNGVRHEFPYEWFRNRNERLAVWWTQMTGTAPVYLEEAKSREMWNVSETRFPKAWLPRLQEIRIEVRSLDGTGPGWYRR